jgi:hypothetical protein
MSIIAPQVLWRTYWPRTLRSSVRYALVELSCRERTRFGKGRTLLSDEKTVALLEGDAMSGSNKSASVVTSVASVCSRHAIRDISPRVKSFSFLSTSVVCSQSPNRRAMSTQPATFCRFLDCPDCLFFLIPPLPSWRDQDESFSYLEYLSSGEKRAGWADFVTSAPLTFFKV